MEERLEALRRLETREGMAVFDEGSLDGFLSGAHVGAAKASAIKAANNVGRMENSISKRAIDARLSVSARNSTRATTATVHARLRLAHGARRTGS